ncbi:trans-aconitate 2-methyltransferase [Streptomyces mirabilis]|jgi:Methylase involved in ubiquinone/menaquinone biosynthesis|uniref:Class I SAM-dependent methyltransferase n=1 Tax=Streptomyces mirabilis TaxID=68239 RepID=A0ABU3V7E0_9ACTN|nr:class I SAM-dependent methyltransferase [Streptomyces mirabilis]MCX4617547.1 class I SAM-dependent methyltransferase [Streptomyces mirabilis]MDU9002094.1 class I SAM-dependent methyltransferase [Streptomyces mirabilis]
MHDDALLAEQMAYYKAGAAEYDRPYAEYEDLQKLLAAVDDLPIAGDVLELACGTGQWTPRLAARAQSVTAVDASPEVLALARARTASPTVQFLEADLFEWQPPRRYDTVFFAFWLSHVPPTRLPDFWNTVATALAPGGKAIFIDDGPAAAAYEEVLANQTTPTALRRLDDGSQYRIVKVFHDAQTLTDDLTAQGWSVRIRPMAGNFIGIAEPPTTAG